MNPILLDLPMPITTPRLILRPPKPGDGVELNAAIIETFEDLALWMPWARQKPTVDETEENVRRAHAQWNLRADLRIIIVDRVSGSFAGNTGLHRINWEIPRFEIGYWVRKKFAGQGYITEATNALTRYAFEELKARRVEIRCDPKNTKSISVMKRLGFEHEGTLRNDSVSVSTEEPRDTAIYSRLNTSGLPELEVKWSKSG